MATQRIHASFLTIAAVLSSLAAVLLAWCAVVRPPLWPTTVDHWWILAAYFMLLLVAWAFPVRIGQQWSSVLLSVVIPLFLQFGVVLTVVLAFASWIVSQVGMGKHLGRFRILMNFAVYTLMALAAALAFHLAGGTLMPDNWSTPLAQVVWPVMAFFLAGTAVNFLLTRGLVYLLGRGRERLSPLGVLWELMAGVNELLLAWIFVIVLHAYGLAWFPMAVAAFLVGLIGFRLYSDLLIANQQLSAISDASIKLNRDLSVDLLITGLMDTVPHLVQASVAALFLPDELGVLRVSAVRAQSPVMEETMSNWSVQDGEGLIGRKFSDRHPLLQRRTARSLTGMPSTVDEWMRSPSILIVPIVYQEHRLGILVMTNRESNGFCKRDLKMTQILAGQAAVGLWNARKLQQSRVQSYTDQLTGVYNYRYFVETLEEMCAESNETGAPVSLLVVDLDFFKSVNDAFGHDVGNAVLQRVAQILKHQVRDRDVVCRYGGEEFMIILPRASIDTGVQIAERLRRAVEATPISVPPVGNTAALPVRVTASIGVATYPEMADSPQSLLRNADRAMYVGSKQAGRNRVGIYGEAVQ